MLRYNTITKILSKEQKRIYKTVYFPKVGDSMDDVYIITKFEDRLDLIAYDFYGDPSLYWIIAVANNLQCDSYFPPVGIQLKIPANHSDIISRFNNINP